MTHVDSMAGMPIPQTGTPDIEPGALLSLGLRAAWLHLHLTSPAALALAPRDRETLTLVATRPHGITHQSLVEHLHAVGVSTTSAVHWIDRLIAQGWISRTGNASDALVDLPAADLEWISEQRRHLTPGRAPRQDQRP